MSTDPSYDLGYFNGGLLMIQNIPLFKEGSIRITGQCDLCGKRESESYGLESVYHNDARWDWHVFEYHKSGSEACVRRLAARIWRLEEAAKFWSFEDISEIGTFLGGGPLINESK